MVKSYTLSQRNNRFQNREQPVYLTLPIVVPKDITDNIKNQMFNVLSVTPFNKLSFSVQVFRKSIERFREDRYGNDRPNKRNLFVNVGFLQKFNSETKEFEVMIFGSMAEDIKKFSSPAIEIVYTETREGDLRVINKFNIIDMGNRHRKAPQSTPSTESSATVAPKESKQPAAAVDVKQSDVEAIPVTIGDVIKEA